MNLRDIEPETGQRVAATVRCVVLLTVVVMSEAGRFSGEGSLGMDLTLAIGAAYVLLTTSPFRRLLPGDMGRGGGLMVAADVLFITMLIWFGGRMHSQFYLLYYLPVLHASLRLNFRDAITSSVLAAACYLFVGVSSGFDEPILTSAYLRIAAFGVSALVLAVFFTMLAGEARASRVLAASLQQAIDSLKTVYNVARTANTADTLQEVLDSLLAQASRMVCAEAGFIGLRNDEGELEVAASLASPEDEDGPPAAEFDRELAEQVHGAEPVAQVKNALPSRGKEASWRTALCVPLQTGTQTLGIVQLWSPWEKSFSTQEMELVGALCAELSVAVENARLRTELRHAASTDPLTGLLNRTEFHERLTTEVKRADRHGYPLSLILVDIDDFKACNDTCGHAAGDQVLRTLSTVIRDTIRTEDIAGRYGGDEFTILLPHADGRGAHGVAESLCKRFNQRLFTTDGAIYKVTLSAGVATLGDEPSATLLMRKADRALFQAKQNGKNQVILWTGGDIPDDLVSPIRHDA